MGAKETEDAIKAAEAAFPAWSKTTAKVCMLPVYSRNEADSSTI